MVENQVGERIKVLRTDNGGEYVNHRFDSFLAVHGIQHQRTNDYTPQENDVAERMNRTLLNITRTLLERASLPKTMWADALLTANYLRNVWLTLQALPVKFGPVESRAYAICVLTGAKHS